MLHCKFLCLHSSNKLLKIGIADVTIFIQCFNNLGLMAQSNPSFSYLDSFIIVQSITDWQKISFEQIQQTKISIF